MSLRDALLHEFRSIFTLRQASLSSSTFRDYSKHVHLLTQYISALELGTATPHELDVSLASYGLHLYDGNPGSGNLQKFRCSFFGAIFFLSKLKASLNRARQTEKGWDRLVPFRSQPPLFSSTVDAISAWLAFVGKSRDSLAINLGFHAFLRANEIFRIQVIDFCFANDSCLSYFLSQRARCVVRNAKTGMNQFIPLTDDTLRRRLQRFIRSKPAYFTSLFQLSYN